MAVGWAVCGGTVVSTHAVLGEFAQIVVGDSVDVVTIIPSGFCPAQYDLSPKDLAAVIDASLILYSGFEPWIETLADAAGSDALVIQLPGSWSTPAAAVEKVEAIRDLLAERFPEFTDLFAANADAYIDDLRALGAALKERAAVAEVASIPVVCMEWQVDFVSWLGFDVAVTYGIPATLSLRDLIDLAAAGNEADAELVIDNLQSGVDFGAKLAREVSAVHVVLSNFPGAMPNTVTVIDLFTRNADALLSAIEPIE
jgi:ABC-type Zn uptake system ZnuABC Zn-binding protein ZnuA